MNSETVTFIIILSPQGDVPAFDRTQVSTDKLTTPRHTAMCFSAFRIIVS